MNKDAEDYDLNPVIRPGQEIDQGFQDVSGAYPKVQYIGKSSVNTRALGADKVYREYDSIRGARASSDIPQTAAPTLKEPKDLASPRYPYNSVTETKSGHVIEYDDTPGYERINIEHRTGSRIEMLADGSVIVKSSGDAYSLIAGDDRVVVRGSVNIVVESNANLRVKGDMNLQVDGDLNQLVQGNYNLEIQGDKNIRGHGYEKTSITKSSLHEVRGNVINRYLSNYRERIVGDFDTEIGGDWTTTSEGAIYSRSYGPITASFGGGIVDLNGKDSNESEGQGEIIAEHVFAKDSVLSSSVFASDIDVENEVKVGSKVHSPEFEGIAKRAEFADTAGSAPTGPAITKVAQPSSPETIEGPNSPDIPVVDVLDTSDIFILNLDRQPLSQFNSRILNIGEAVSRCRNKFLRSNADFISDLVENDTIEESIASTPRYRVVRRSSDRNISAGENVIGQNFAQSSHTLSTRNILRVQSIPSQMRLKGKISKSSKISPHFRLSHMLSGDSLVSPLRAHSGLSIQNVLDNIQLSAYNILEPLYNKYKSTWSISEAFYNIFENEQIDESSLTVSFAQGMAVGIQLRDRSQYFDVACWIKDNMVYENLVLSYIDYDPYDINEPTIIITIKNGTNSKNVWTEVNHKRVEDGIAELNVES